MHNLNDVLFKDKLESKNYNEDDERYDENLSFVNKLNDLENNTEEANEVQNESSALQNFFRI